MLKRFIVALTALLAFAVFAADVNTASQAELEAIKGIGPVIASKILDERKKTPFKDWSDLVNRVKGMGGTSANRFSTQGLTVNGAAYAGSKTAAPLASKSASAVATTASAAPTATQPATDKGVGTLVKTNTLSSSATPQAASVASSASAKKTAH